MVFNRSHLSLCSVFSNSSWPHGLQPAKFLHPWNFQARILEWVAIPYSRDSSQPQIKPGFLASPALAGRFFTTNASWRLPIPAQYRLHRWLRFKRMHLPIQELQEIQIQSLVWEDPLEEEMATHSSVLAQKIPWTEEPGRLLSMRSQSNKTEHIHTSLTHTQESQRICVNSRIHCFKD